MYDVLQLAPGFSPVLPGRWLPETELAGRGQDRWNRRPNRRMEVMLVKEKCRGDKVQCWGLCPTNFIGTRDLGRSVFFWFSLFPFLCQLGFVVVGGWGWVCLCCFRVVYKAILLKRSAFLFSVYFLWQTSFVKNLFWVLIVFQYFPALSSLYVTLFHVHQWYPAVYFYYCWFFFFNFKISLFCNVRHFYFHYDLYIM